MLLSTPAASPHIAGCDNPSAHTAKPVAVPTIRLMTTRAMRKRSIWVVMSSRISIVSCRGTSERPASCTMRCL